MPSDMRTALIVGGSGFLGDALIQAAAEQLNVFGTHKSRPIRKASIKFDLSRDDPEALVNKVDPQLIVLAAHIEPMLTERSSHEHAKSFLQACGNRRLIYISSDAVFDGRRGLYSENDPVSPDSIYGEGLAFMEDVVRDNCPDHIVVRPSYLFGFSKGGLDSRLEATRSCLLQGQKVSLFGDMFKSPLEINEAAAIILKIEAMRFTGTVHVAGHRMSVFDFHRDAMQALGIHIHHLIAEKIPSDSGFLRDTSLSIRHMLNLIGRPPRTISAALSDRGSPS